jgi:hypothetical protein
MRMVSEQDDKRDGDDRDPRDRQPEPTPGWPRRSV